MCTWQLAPNRVAIRNILDDFVARRAGRVCEAEAHSHRALLQPALDPPPQQVHLALGQLAGQGLPGQAGIPAQRCHLPRVDG